LTISTREISVATRLTDRGIGALLTPAHRSVYYFDSEVHGLLLRVYPSGRKVFAFDWRENGRQKRTTLGAFPTWTIGKARTHASKLRLKADTGETVVVGRGSRVADLIEEWMEVVAVTRRPSTTKVYRGMIDGYILPAFGRDELKALTRNRIEHWHGRIAQRVPVRANRVLATLSSFLSWCERDRRIDHNPAKGVRKGTESPRETFLSASEIAAAHKLLAASNKRSAALALRLLLLTGARVGEVLTLDASQIDTDRKIWVKPAAFVKTKRDHIIPLQPEAFKIARQLLEVGVPTYTHVRYLWDQIKVVIGRPEARVHDIRHSRASSLARAGASLVEIGAVLGHRKAQTTQRYTHLVDGDLRKLVERAR
jgi:integrase